MFRTELPIAPASTLLPRTARVLTVGSCFADSIGLRLTQNKVDALVNPFGTVFQPLALGRLLRAAAGEDVDWQQHLVEARGRWQSYDLHGSIGADSPVELLQTIQELVRRTGEFLRTADVVLLTLGTAWAYRLRETGELVSNCHKQSADLFVRELLTPDEIINSLAETHAYLRRLNPALRFVLTVSPVRHLKDTLPLNAVSKSVLRVATHFVSDLLPDVAYFPAYELLLDELRDYRFYAADMLHPSEVAEDYIWDKFARTYFDADFGRFRQEWTGVRQALAHRPLHPGAPEYRQFLASTLDKLEQLSLRKVAVDDELRTVRTQLATLPVAAQPRLAAVVEEDDEERIDIGNVPTDAPLDVRPAPTVVELPPVAGGRPPRLSPEEFRAQRAAGTGRSDRGRRGGRGQQPIEQHDAVRESEQVDEQIQATAAFTGEFLATQPGSPKSMPLAAEGLGDALEAATQAVGAALTPPGSEANPLAQDEPAKKKKRRSRGGAKRTARKNALRLTEELPQSDAASAGEVQAEDRAVVSDDNRKSSVITKSVPVKRGGRRNEPMPRPIPVADAAALPAADAPGLTNQPVAPVLRSTDLVPEQTAPDINSGELAATTGPVSRSSRSRNNRKKNRKPDSGTAAADSPNENLAALASTEPTAPAVGSRGGGANTQRKSPKIAANEPSVAADENVAARPLPIPATQPAAPQETAPPVAAAEAGRKASRPKRRAVSGARAEKPAVDMPIIPVVTGEAPRTQVAAGRMAGSSAQLIAPTTPTAAKAAAKVASRQKAGGAVVKAVGGAPKVPVVSPPVAAATAAEPPVVAPVKATAKPRAAKPAAAKVKPAAQQPVEVPPKPIAAKALKATPTTAKPVGAKPAAKKATPKPTPAKPPVSKPKTAKQPAKPKSA